ncbi:MAG: GGDEF domain-containing protein [Gammaproteobacteria bacterium]|nr:GGDEF domain-containing protein [Gammaproteobacteria bacterium]
MKFKNKPNLVLFLGISTGAFFWIFDATIDVMYFDVRKSLFESITSLNPHELYMRSTVFFLIVFISFFARTLLLKEESVSHELEKHKNNLEELVSTRTEQLEILATIDDLTQAYNRRRFFELARYEIERNARHQHPLSVMIIDVDHFKSINDLHGHQVGDQTLQLLSGTISSVIRATDIFGRIGGEEFSIVLPETTKQSAKEFSERIRLCIENEKFPVVDNITISIGVTQLYTDDTSTSIFNRADIALYAAKGAGRNCVVTA